MTIDLQQFCTEPDEFMRYEMSKPWSDGPWRYATNSRIIVRVPAEPGDKPDGVPDAPYLFSDFHAERCTEELPQWDGSMYEYQGTCDHPECRGGKVIGGQKDCPDCHGKGTTPESMPTTVAFQGFNFKGDLISKIHGLDNARGYVWSKLLAGQTTIECQMQFTFDGGQGLLMPISTIITTEGIQKCGK